jgi:hypothetical protein
MDRRELRGNAAARAIACLREARGKMLHPFFASAAR